MPFIEGLGYGLATVLLIGPVFFTLLKASFEHGAKGGIAVALGIITSDVLIVVILCSGLASALTDLLNGAWMAIAAGVILAAMGIRYMMAPNDGMYARARLSGKGALALFTSGFLVNFINPFVFAIWLALVMHVSGAHPTGEGSLPFLVGALLGIFITDIGKAVLAPQLKQLLTPSMLKKVHVIIGIALLLFSIRAFVYAVQHWD